MTPILSWDLSSGIFLSDSSVIHFSENDAKRVENWVNEAVSQGAKILVGGKREGPIYGIKKLVFAHR